MLAERYGVRATREDSRPFVGTGENGPASVDREAVFGKGLGHTP
jgi:hypothetical protein